MEIVLSNESLAQVGIKLLNKYRVQLRCEACGMVWRPVPCPEVRLPHGWWICPRGCNRHYETAMQEAANSHPSGVSAVT